MLIMQDTEIYFRQINLNNRIDATAEIEAGINQVHLLQEPYTNIVKGECGVDKKNKCYCVPFGRAAIYAPDVRDVTILPIWDLMSQDMAVVLMESKAERKPLLIVSLYCHDSATENAVTQDLIKVSEYSTKHDTQLLIGADTNIWSSMWHSTK